MLGIDISQGHTAVGRGGDENDTHTGGDLMTRALRGNPTSGMACSVLVDVLCGSALQVLPAWQKLGCGHCIVVLADETNEATWTLYEAISDKIMGD